VKLKVEGRENIENLSLPVIFMPNHLSYIDSAVLAMALPFRIRKKIAFAAAVNVLYEKYQHVAWLAQILFNSFRFPVQESKSIQYGLQYMGRRLDQGCSVIVYPEGRISITGKLQSFKRGAGLIATTMNTETIPVKIAGAEKIVPFKKILPRKRGIVTVTFGKPVQFNLSDSYINTTAKIQKLVEKL
jgi:1-acyl-sn-glycerol-3-phosphate acyltransferase